MTIWKTPDVKPDPADEIVFMIGDLPTVGWYFSTDDEFLDPSTNNRYAPDEIDRWAIFTDLIAQADKAERLQKAVDLALERFDDIRRLYDKYYDKYSVIATETTEEIKQIIKEN